MKLPDVGKLTNDALMLWVMHRFADAFREHAILKGGMQLMLLSSERHTNDLDYVFVPFDSKNDVADRIEKLLGEIPGVLVERTMHSNTGRYGIRVGKAAIQIEFNVASTMASAPITTDMLATRVGELPRLIRVMASDVALAHKLAAWNERRLIRDLYDVYYWVAIIKTAPHIETLKIRLKAVKSRIPALKKVKVMTLAQFVNTFSVAIDELTDRDLRADLAGLLSPERLVGLTPVLKAKLSELAAELERQSQD